MRLREKDRKLSGVESLQSGSSCKNEVYSVLMCGDSCFAIDE